MDFLDLQRRCSRQGHSLFIPSGGVGRARRTLEAAARALIERRAGKPLWEAGRIRARVSS